jgi:hypothetical protein
VPSAQRRSGCAQARDCQKPRRRDISAVVSHSASLAGQAMNRYRGTQAEFQFSIVSPHTAHSNLADLARLCNVFAAVINRAALTSSMGTDHRTSSPVTFKLNHCQRSGFALSGSRLSLAALFHSSPIKRRMPLIDQLDALAVVFPQAKKRPQRARR